MFGICAIMAAKAQAEFEAKRREEFDKLPRDVQEWELRKREVYALEEIARKETVIKNHVSLF